mmetsp:Transcript_27283/g.57156  ORF Transcript_27283/g.57156 Transcript_27283/m.57156 type:complete len:215 (+) Transcript_27283:79-723(+)
MTSDYTAKKGTNAATVLQCATMDTVKSKGTTVKWVGLDHIRIPRTATEIAEWKANDGIIDLNPVRIHAKEGSSRVFFAHPATNLIATHESASLAHTIGCDPGQKQGPQPRNNHAPPKGTTTAPSKSIINLSFVQEQIGILGQVRFHVRRFESRNVIRNQVGAHAVGSKIAKRLNHFFIQVSWIPKRAGFCVDPWVVRTTPPATHGQIKSKPEIL